MDRWSRGWSRSLLQTAGGEVTSHQCSSASYDAWDDLSREGWRTSIQLSFLLFGPGKGCGYTVPVGEEGSLCGHWSSDLRFSDRSVDSRPPNLALFAMQTCLALDLGTTEVHPRRDRLCVSGFLEDQLLTVKTGAVSMVSKMAMKLPTAVAWPESQVLFLLIGGKDNFRRHQRMRYQDRGSGERPGQDWCRPLQEAEGEGAQVGMEVERRLLVRGHLSIDEYIMETRTMGFADGSGELSRERWSNGEVRVMSKQLQAMTATGVVCNLLVMSKCHQDLFVILLTDLEFQFM
eukprot:s1269_g14.t1